MIVFINAQDFEWDLFPFICCSYLGPFLQGSWNPLWTWRKPQLLYVETDNTSEGKCMLVKCWLLLLNLGVESIDCFSHYLQESPYTKYLNVVCEITRYREFPCYALLLGAVSENSESTGKPTNWCSFFCYTYDTRSKYLVVSEPLWCPSSSWSNWCCQEQLCLMSW